MKPKRVNKCRSWISGEISRIWCQWKKGHVGCHSGYQLMGKVKWNNKGFLSINGNVFKSAIRQEKRGNK